MTGSDLDPVVSTTFLRSTVVQVVADRSITPRTLGTITTRLARFVGSRPMPQHDVQRLPQQTRLVRPQLAVAVEIKQAQDPSQTLRSRSNLDHLALLL